MTRQFARPVLQPSLDWVLSDNDASTAHRIAHETSWALLNRVREGADPEVVARVVAVASGDGIDDIAELWANESTHTLAGVLWRMYLLRRIVETDAAAAADQFARGSARIGTIDPIVAGALEPVSPDSIAALCDEILRGAFTGDLGDALDRSAAYARVMAAGAVELADMRDSQSDAEASELTTRALRYQTIARELDAGAARWRNGSLS